MHHLDVRSVLHLAHYFVALFVFVYDMDLSGMLILFKLICADWTDFLLTYRVEGSGAEVTLYLYTFFSALLYSF